MSFDVRQVARSDSSLRQRLADDGFLGRSVGRGDARGASILIHGGAADQPENLVAVEQRVGQALEDHRAASFGANVAVGLGVKRLAAAVGGHHAGVRKSDGHFRGEDEIHGACNRQIGLFAAQTLAGHMNRDEG